MRDSRTRWLKGSSTHNALVRPCARLLCVAALSISVIGCDTTKGAPRDELVVHLYGSKKVFETYQVTAQGPLVADDSPTFDYNRFRWRFRGSRPLHELKNVGLLLESRAGEEPIDSLLLEPFVCATWPTYEKRHSEGWSAVETHNYMLSEYGYFAKGSTLDARLSYTCEVESPDGGDGEGTSTLEASSNDCLAPERAGTVVSLHVEGSEWPSPISAKTCQAAYTTRNHGTLAAVFSFEPAASVSLNVQLADCFATDLPTFPLTLAADTKPDMSQCPQFTQANWTNLDSTEPPVQVRATQGTWTVGEMNLATGRLVADVDITFPKAASWPAFVISGHVDLPLLALETAP